jgi:hypothetical protein
VREMKPSCVRDEMKPCVKSFVSEMALRIVQNTVPVDSSLWLYGKDLNSEEEKL